MANKKLNDLTADSTLNDTDLMWKDTAGSAASQKITGAELKTELKTALNANLDMLSHDLAGTNSSLSIGDSDTAGTSLDAGTNCGRLTILGGGAFGGGTSTSGNTNSTFIGYNAGYNTAGADSSTALGCYAGYSAGGAYDEGYTAVGAYAGYSATSSEGATFLGKSAAQNIASARFSTFVGNCAAGATQTSTNSTYVGALAGNVATSSNNTAVGYQTLLSATGARNVAVGVEAGSAITTGTDNVVVGYQTGDAITTGTRNIVIGKLADTSGATASDELVINQGGVAPISGSMGAVSDVDYSGNTLTITGPSAYASASTNQDGGDLVVRGGLPASGGGTGGTFNIADSGDSTKLMSFDVSAITTATTRTLTMPDADVDLSAVGKWNVEDTTNGNYGHGLNALDSVTVGSGLNNLAIGTSAGTALTTGDNNVFIGNEAGDAVTSAQEQTLVGRSAGGAITTGRSNTCVGFQAGDTTATGVYNVAVGWNADFSGSTVGYSVAVGGNCTAGSNAVTVGNSSNSDNSGVAVGNSARAEAFSVAVGSGACSANTSGPGSNVAVGRNALETVTSGSYNVGIGASVGDNLTTGYHGIFIGYNNEAINATDYYQLVIGHGSRATTVYPIDGYSGAEQDSDMSGKNLTITGPSAWASASTNQDGGDLIMQGGQKASGGGSNGYALHNDNCYGIMSVQAGSTAETTTDGTPRKIAAWNTDGIANGVTIDSTTGNDITIDVAGTYMINVQCSFSGTASKQFDGEIYKNGVATGFAWDRKLGAGGDVGSASCVGIVTCAATDTIEVYHWSTDGGTTFTVTEAQLSVHRISD